MMNAVHARRDDDQVQNPFDVNRQPPVGMMKECRGLRVMKNEHQHHGCDAEDHHCERKKSDGKNHLAKVKSRRSAYIEIEIGVMHVMKPPEKRNHVVRPVPPPVGVIHQQERGDASNPKRQTQASVNKPICSSCAHIATAMGLAT